MTEESVSTVTPFPGTVPGQHQQPKLLDRIRIAIRTRHYSLRTEEAYVGWIKRYIFFHKKRHPLEMGEPEIYSFLSALAVQSHVSASTQNQALSALLFLYRNVLGKPFPTLENLIRAKRPVRLPAVLTRDEVRRILGKMNGTNRIIATLLYGSGMRLLNACGCGSKTSSSGSIGSSFGTRRVTRIASFLSPSRCGPPSPPGSRE